MSKFKIGDRVRRTTYEFGGMHAGDESTVVDITRSPYGSDQYVLLLRDYGGKHDPQYFELVDTKPTPVVPSHYAFPGGVRVHQISGHLTSFGGQALQYIARSTRLDGQNKGDTAENLRKAIRFLELEIERIEA